MFFGSRIEDPRSVIDYSRMVMDDFRVTLQLVASFMITIFL
jgi:hypothetical protein